MGRAGSVRCPTCKSTRTKTAVGRRAQQTRRLSDDGILRAHKCLDCERLFLTVQRVIETLDEAADVDELRAG